MRVFSPTIRTLVQVLCEPRFWLFVSCWPLRALRHNVAQYRDNAAQARFPGVSFGQGIQLPLQDLSAVRIGRGTKVLDDVELLVDSPASQTSGVCIDIGQHCKIGRRSQLGSGGGSFIKPGDYVRCHNNCVILGNIRIYSYSILSANIFISSGDHHFRRSPEMLIDDQDRLSNNGLPLSSPRVNIVEEDVWVGWGVVMRAGITIGRGAVIRANSVVTRSVAPYSVVAGAPAKQIGMRLAFNPPTTLNAACPTCMPYFYRGFLHHLSDRSVCAAKGYIRHRSECVIMVPPSDEVDVELAAAYGDDLMEVTGNGALVDHTISSRKDHVTVSLRGMAAACVGDGVTLGNPIALRFVWRGSDVEDCGYGVHPGFSWVAP